MAVDTQNELCSNGIVIATISSKERVRTYPRQQQTQLKPTQLKRIWMSSSQQRMELQAGLEEHWQEMYNTGLHGSNTHRAVRFG